MLHNSYESEILLTGKLLVSSELENRISNFPLKSFETLHECGSNHFGFCSSWFKACLNVKFVVECNCMAFGKSTHLDSFWINTNVCFPQNSKPIDLVCPTTFLGQLVHSVLGSTQQERTCLSLVGLISLFFFASFSDSNQTLGKQNESMARLTSEKSWN